MMRWGSQRIGAKKRIGLGVGLNPPGWERLGRVFGRVPQGGETRVKVEDKDQGLKSKRGTAKSRLSEPSTKKEKNENCKKRHYLGISITGKGRKVKKRKPHREFHKYRKNRKKNWRVKDSRKKEGRKNQQKGGKASAEKLVKRKGDRSKSRSYQFGD